MEEKTLMQFRELALTIWPEVRWKRVEMRPCLVNSADMKIATIIARILLGLVFTVFGSNAFLHFIPMPPMSGPSGDFMMAMVNTHYVYVVGFCQVAGGLILLIGRY